GRAGFVEAQAWPRGEGDIALVVGRTGEGSGAGEGARIVLTADPASLPAPGSLAVLAGDGATAADLLAAMDRALEDGLDGVSVSRSGAIPAPEAVDEAVSSPPEETASPALHGRPQLLTPYVAPRSETEQAIAEIWQKALGIDRVGV